MRNKSLQFNHFISIVAHWTYQKGLVCISTQKTNRQICELVHARNLTHWKGKGIKTRLYWTVNFTESTPWARAGGPVIGYSIIWWCAGYWISPRSPPEVVAALYYWLGECKQTLLFYKNQDGEFVGDAQWRAAYRNVMYLQKQNPKTAHCDTSQRGGDRPLHQLSYIDNYLQSFLSPLLITNEQRFHCNNTSPVTEDAS